MPSLIFELDRKTLYLRNKKEIFSLSIKIHCVCVSCQQTKTLFLACSLFLLISLEKKLSPRVFWVLKNHRVPQSYTRTSPSVLYESFLSKNQPPSLFFSLILSPFLPAGAVFVFGHVWITLLCDCVVWLCCVWFIYLGQGSDSSSSSSSSSSCTRLTSGIWQAACEICHQSVRLQLLGEAWKEAKPGVTHYTPIFSD